MGSRIRCARKWRPGNMLPFRGCMRKERFHHSTRRRSLLNHDKNLIHLGLPLIRHIKLSVIIPLLDGGHCLQGICCICIHLNVMKNLDVLTVNSHSKTSQSQTLENGKILICPSTQLHRSVKHPF